MYGNDHKRIGIKKALKEALSVLEHLKLIDLRYKRESIEGIVK